MYKLYTGLLTRLLIGHMIEHDLLPVEQKALRKGRRGCLGALAIDGAVWRDLAVAWIDYHKCIRKMLKSIRTPKPARRS